MKKEILERRMQQVFHDEKWKIFMARSWPWKFVPFVEFVLAAGSMATGEVHERSDFDVIVGAKRGRIFTARFFSIIVFGLLGWRRRKLSHKDSAMNKICLNHFVTEDSFALPPPHNAYWQALYRALVPLFGDEARINSFFRANEGLTGRARIYRDDLRHHYRVSSTFARTLMFLLSGSFGNWVERMLKRFQIARIEKSLRHDPPGWNPRIRYSDSELEFHPDTKRIDSYVRTHVVAKDSH